MNQKQKQTHRPSTTPGTVYQLDGLTFHWCRYGRSYAICSSRGDMAILPSSNQTVKVIRASGQTEYVVIGPLLRRESGRLIWEFVKNTFSPVPDTETKRALGGYIPLDGFHDQQECAA